MKLTLEQKRYRKQTIFANEIELLQQKIDNLELSSPLTIKKLHFDYNNSQNIRICCIIFNEKYTSINSITKKKERINKWAGVNFIYDRSGVKRNGLRINKVFVYSGVRYDDNGIEIQDEDIRKVCDLLVNEYFLWITCIDKYVAIDIKQAKQRGIYNGINNLEDYVKEDYYFMKYYMLALIKRINIAFNDKYSKYSPNELITNYNDQIKRGLIIDCPFEKEEFPFNDIESGIILSEYVVEFGGLYG